MKLSPYSKSHIRCHFYNYLQIKNLKALVNLKLPGAFMGESEVLQEVETDRKLRKEEIFTHFIDQTMGEKKEEAKQESEASRWEKARPRSLEYYNQVFHQTQTFSQIQGAPKKLLIELLIAMLIFTLQL